MHFQDYAQYYDLLYKDKDYHAESSFIDTLIKNTTPKNGNLLEIGCGTGKHAEILSQLGYKITGIDISEQMLQIALDRNKTNENKPNFQCVSVQDFQPQQKFDTIISLFHVVSYFNSNQSLTDLFTNVSRLLKPGGTFLFDYWYLPTVLTHPPKNKIKKVENDFLAIERETYIEHLIHENIVVVNFKIYITDKLTKKMTTLNEKHPMRYFSNPEIEYILTNLGFDVIKQKGWMSLDSIKDDDWGVYTLARKKS